jgi:hypothetical protein
MKSHMMRPWGVVLLLLAGCPGGPSDPTEPPPPTGSSPRLTTVTVTCTPTSVPSHGSASCNASATDQDGAPFSVPAYTWTSSDERVAQVDAQGSVLTTQVGTVTVTASATVEGVTRQGQASLTVIEKEPTLHTTPITTHETWRVRDNPHLVRGTVPVTVSAEGVPATLTLEAGVVVLFDEDAQLIVEKGALKAPGTPALPIRLVAHQLVPTPGFWRALRFAESAGESLLEYVSLSDCGRKDPERADTCLEVLNTTLVMRDVTVRNSATVGVSFGSSLGPSGGAGAGSARLSVLGSKETALYIPANQAGTLPRGGTFTGNRYNEIWLSGTVRRSQTWPNLGIPYYLLDFAQGIDGNDSTPTTLTLEAGTELRFAKGTSFPVGTWFSSGPADLIVNGTEEAPVRFTSDSSTPAPGDWDGVLLGNITSNTRISHAIIEYAGGGRYGISETANLIVSDSPFCTECPLLDHVLLQKSSTHGLNLQARRLAAGSTGVTIRESGGYAILAAAESVGGLPPGFSLTTSGNSPDAVRVQGSVYRSQTWPNLGIPYDLPKGLEVMGDRSTSSRTTLTLSAGTVLRFGAQKSLRMGGFSDPVDLIVNGTEEAPVRFTSMSNTPRPGDWSGVFLGDGITSATRISHAIIEYGGSNPGSTSSLGLNAWSGSKARPTLDHVVLSKSSFHGLSLFGMMLSEGSTGVTIRESGSHAISADANSVGGIPAGTVFIGNSPDAVRIASDEVTTTQTWPALGIPYLLSGSLRVRSTAWPTPTLTLAAGAELRFPQDSALDVGAGWPGALVVEGTGSAPVRLVPNTPTPFKGFWRGVHLHEGATGSRIDHAFISHGGASGHTLQGNLNVYKEQGGIVTHSTFSDSSTCGIMVSTGSGSTGPVTTDFTLPAYGNTFLDNTTASQCGR